MRLACSCHNTTLHFFRPLIYVMNMYVCKVMYYYIYILNPDFIVYRRTESLILHTFISGIILSAR